jgi:hypothetical protein
VCTVCAGVLCGRCTVCAGVLCTHVYCVYCVGGAGAGACTTGTRLRIVQAVDAGYELLLVTHLQVVLDGCSTQQQPVPAPK